MRILNKEDHSNTLQILKHQQHGLKKDKQNPKIGNTYILEHANHSRNTCSLYRPRLHNLQGNNCTQGSCEKKHIYNKQAEQLIEHTLPALTGIMSSKVNGSPVIGHFPQSFTSSMKRNMVFSDILHQTSLKSNCKGRRGCPDFLCL